MIGRAPTPVYEDLACGVEVVAFDSTDSEACLAGSPELLDETERERRDAFVFQRDRDRFTVAHTALRILIGERLSRRPQDVRFAFRPCPRCGGSHGKPCLAGDLGLEWSLAHSGPIVLIALAAVEVGVDVERVVRPHEVEELAAALAPPECDAIAALSPDLRPAAFTQCWARKEAYLKGIGIGLAATLSECWVGLGERHGQGPDQIDGWRLRDLEVRSGFAGALAFRRSD